MSHQASNFWRGRRVLVTGASGFLGRAVVASLSRRGADVHGTGVSRVSAEPAVHHRAVLPADANALVQDVRPQSVIHLAAPVVAGAAEAQRGILRDGIVDAAMAVADATGRHGIPMLHCGTCAEYGRAPAPFKESGPAQPVDAYGALKLEATEQVLALGHVSVVRPFRAIGPGDSSSVIAQAAQAALADRVFSMTSGEQVREWNHVQAIADGLVCAAATPSVVGRVVNIGGGQRVSVLDAVYAVFDAAGVSRDRVSPGSRPQRPNEVPLLVGDHSLAQSLWGVIEQPTFEATIRETLLWHQQNQEDAA